MTSQDVTGAPSGAEKPVETTAARFRADVLEPSLRRPVLVDFWAPWCGPCKQFGPALERVVRAAKGKVALVTINIDEHPQIADQLGIKSIPAVIAFDRGRAADGFVGALPDSQIRGFVERLVGPIEDDADAMAEVQALIDAGDVAGAAMLLTQLVRQEPPLPRAIAELLRLYTEAERFEDARTLLDTTSDATKRDKAVIAAIAALENAEQAAALDDVGDLQRRVAAKPDDMQTRFDLALALNARGLREEAADALLDIMRHDRSWSDDGARKQLLQFFEAWGPVDRATVSARRRLSAMLFA
jgi:putative thioredoxin